MNRAEMKNNKSNIRREGDFNMKGMNAVSEVSIERVKEIYKQLEKPLGLMGNVELPDEVIEAKYNEVNSSSTIKEFMKGVVFVDNFVDINTRKIKRINELIGLSRILSKEELDDMAYFTASLYIAVAVAIMKENYAEGILQEVIAEVQQYELSEDAEDRMDLIVTLVMPEEDLQVIKTFQAFMSGDAQLFIDELDKFGTMMGIQK
jgi:hypothetical protein